MLTAGTVPEQTDNIDRERPRARLAGELRDFVNRAAGPDFVRRIAAVLGQDEQRTESAFSMLFGAAVRRLASASATREATEALHARLFDQQVSVDLSDALVQLFAPANASPPDSPDPGDTAAHALFGHRAGSLVLSVGTATGMSFESVWKLACFVTPFAYAALADFASRHELDAARLRTLLASECSRSRHSSRRSAGRSMETAGSQAVEAAFEGGARAVERTRAVLADAQTRLPRMNRRGLLLTGLIAAVLAGAVVWAFESTSRRHDAEAASAQALAAVVLPDGQALPVAPGGLIDELVRFLLDPEAKHHKPFVLDAMQFDAQTATLRSASQPQLEQLAVVLAAFPDVKIDIEARSEPLGDAEREKSLAERRALAVRAALGSFGVRPSRMTHASYNSSDVVASPDGSSGAPVPDGYIELHVTNR